MEIAKGYKEDDFCRLDLSSSITKDWNMAIDIFISRMEPRYLDSVRLLIAEDQKSELRKRKFGFAIMAINCLLIETLYSFRNGIIDNSGNARKTFEEFLTQSVSFQDDFNIEMANIFYSQIRNGILHQAETKERSRIRDVGPMVRKVGNSLVINRTVFFKALENEFHTYIDQLNDPSQIELRNAFRLKMSHICGCGA